MALAAHHEPLPQLSKYELLAELGHGGMATVYRARDRRLGREVAVKIIHRHLRDSGEVARRFTAEARAVAKLKHPAIVEIYDVSDDDAPERYLVAELVRGKSLRAVLAERGTLPAEIAAAIGLALSSALAHAHERGVIHRDVKPENVLFSMPWVDNSHEASEPTLAAVKLTDFGIAKLLDQQGVTSTGQVLGSPAYMAPEQIDGEEVDARADVFALGVLLYECMVGHLPFDGRTPGQVLKAILQGHYSPADREKPAIGSRWAAIVHAALEPSSERRTASMNAVHAALESEWQASGMGSPLQELTAFLHDPEAYEQALTERLVPRLREQGRQALRRRDSLGSAAAINRAAALAPGDPEVMALVRQMVRAGSLDRWRLRALQVSGAVVVAGLALAGASRLRRTGPAPVARVLPTPAPLSWPSSSVAAGPVAPASMSGGSLPSPAPSRSAHRLAPPTLGPRASAEPARGERLVRFTLFPPSARWTLDGEPLPDITLHERPLPVGSSHTVVVSTLPNNNCCESPLTIPFTVEPSDTGEPKPVRAVLTLRNATLDSHGPVGLYIACPTLLGSTLVPATGAYPVKMSRVSRDGDLCFLRDGAKVLGERPMHVRAGETSRVDW